MSTATATHNAHAEAEQKKYFHFVNLALFMAAVTGIELVVIFIPLAYWIIMTLVIVLSVVKFVGVIMWFMHLIYDKVLCTLLFLLGLFIATATAVALMLLFSKDHAENPFDELAQQASSPQIIARG